MKKFLLVTLLAVSTGIFAQETEVKAQSFEEEVYVANTIDVRPEYPGGLEVLYDFIKNNFKVPRINKNINVKILISFVVEMDGSMSNIKIVRDPGYGLGKEALRVLKLVEGKWQPGMIKDIPVRASYTLPVAISIHE